mmetsp:Transcript_2521/g.9063  ORF Transcript_2521/g.9063 Transcript_2521/m.9063 type:complete len:394 (+) Transcript_2521:675-1856(+)
MVAGALDDRAAARVAHREAFARLAAREEQAAGGAVEAGVAQDDGVLGGEEHWRRRLLALVVGHQHQLAAAHGLAHVVVRLAHQSDRHAATGEGAEGLARGTAEGEPQVPLEARVAVAACHYAAHAPTGAAILVGDGELDIAAPGTLRRVRLDRRRHRLVRQHLLVQHRSRAVHALRDALRGAVGASAPRLAQQVAQVQPGRLGAHVLPAARAQQLRAAHQLVHGAQAQLRQPLAHLLADEEEEVLQMLGDAREARAQLLALGGHAHRTVVGMADARHDAAGGDHGDGAEAELVRAQHRRHEHVAPALEAAVHAQRHAVAQAVLHEGAVHLHETHFHEAARVLDGAHGGGARAAVAARHLDDIRTRLGHTRGNGADARRGHQLHRHLGARVDLV